MNSGNFTIDCRELTQNDIEFLRPYNIVKHYGFDANSMPYYRCHNYQFEGYDYEILEGFPLISITELRKNQIYELW